MKNFREFTVESKLLKKVFQVQFAWLQNAISIRHSDTVDVKFFVRDGQELFERVVALYHPYLLELSRQLGRELTDPWCCRLAASHLKYTLETGHDIEKVILTPSYEQLRSYATETC